METITTSAPVQALTGQTVRSLAISPQHYGIAVGVEGGVFLFAITGDCCSIAAATELDGVDALLGATITGVEQAKGTSWEVDPPGDDERRTVQPYAVRITTTQGRACLTFHNRHNGYYQGRIEPWGGRHLPDLSQWQPITSDWSA